MNRLRFLLKCQGVKLGGKVLISVLRENKKNMDNRQRVSRKFISTQKWKGRKSPPCAQ